MKINQKTKIVKKDTNPKQAIGTKKINFSTLPANVLGECAVGLTEGAIKYSRHNYRIAGTKASVYYDATLRHLTSWWEGEDIDTDSGMNHVTKAICCLLVLRDSVIRENCNDDRPPKSNSNWVKELNQKTSKLIEKMPPALEPYTELNYRKRRK